MHVNFHNMKVYTTDCLRAICMTAISSKWLSSGDHLYMEHTDAPKWSPPAMYSSLSPRCHTITAQWTNWWSCKSFRKIQSMSHLHHSLYTRSTYVHSSGLSLKTRHSNMIIHLQEFSHDNFFSIFYPAKEPILYRGNCCQYTPECSAAFQDFE